jgi:hypothetical protein
MAYIDLAATTVDGKEKVDDGSVARRIHCRLEPSLMKAAALRGHISARHAEKVDRATRERVRACHTDGMTRHDYPLSSVCGTRIKTG